MVGLAYALLAGYLAAAGAARVWRQLGVVVLGSLLGHGLIAALPWSVADDETCVAIYGLLLVGMGVLWTLGAAWVSISSQLMRCEACQPRCAPA
jgi:hypothetical protein